MPNYWNSRNLRLFFSTTVAQHIVLLMCEAVLIENVPAMDCWRSFYSMAIEVTRVYVFRFLLESSRRVFIYCLEIASLSHMKRRNEQAIEGIGTRTNEVSLTNKPVRYLHQILIGRAEVRHSFYIKCKTREWSIEIIGLHCFERKLEFYIHLL